MTLIKWLNFVFIGHQSSAEQLTTDRLRQGFRSRAQ